VELAIKALLDEARKGDERSLERLISHYRPFILRVASSVCKRSVHWQDDEASIGLLAFHEAVQRFNEEYGRNFEKFAYTVVHDRLKDEFRKNARMPAMESLFPEVPTEVEHSRAEIASSLEQYDREVTTRELAQELLLFSDKLAEFHIRLEELEEESPDHTDTRVQCIRIAKRFMKHSEWLNVLERTKKLPLKEMQLESGVSRKTLERHRKYLISLILIYSFEDFGLIRNTVSFVELGE
jgi:RNA polymerase sigma factor